MITIRGLLLFGFLALLGGCATTPCPDPSHPAIRTDSCHYKFTITKIDAPKGWVTGKYPADLVKKDADPQARFNFLVRDLDWLVSKGLLLEGHDYLFTNGHGSPFLEPFPEGYGYKEPE